MRVKRLTITLPPHLAKTATHDARVIAEAVGKALHQSGATTAPPMVELPGHGLTGPVLAQQVGAKINTGKGGSGHGG